MLAALGATLAPFLGATPGSIITRKNIGPWYQHIKKASLRPPNWAFGPVWTCLYGGMGYASYLVMRDGGDLVSLSLYSTQLVLNWAWTPIFFGSHNVKAAFYEICLLWIAVAATGVNFFHVNKVAGLLFLPYQAWVTLATLLNFSVWQMNGDKPEVAQD